MLFTSWRDSFGAGENRQAEHLSRVLPDGLNGAGLLKASIALMLAGALLPLQGSNGGDKWLRKGCALLDRELHAQILPDGGHVERSPAIMLELLQHLLDLHHVLTQAGAYVVDVERIAKEKGKSWTRRATALF